MNKITMLKRLLKPGLLIVISIILFLCGYAGLSIIILVICILDSLCKLNYYWEKELSSDEFIKSINKGICDNILQFIYPLALIKEDGELIWYNNLFNSLRSNKEANEKNVLSIARGLNLQDILKHEENLHQRLNINEKLYDVYATLIKKDENTYAYLLSFNDITKLIDYETTQEGIMLIEVDNLSEVLDKTEENNRPLLVAEIERMINSYANNLKAMIKKYDTNKTICCKQEQ